MLNDVFGSLPNGLGIALIGYLGLSWILGDIFAGRLSERVYVPTCIQGLKVSEAQARHGVIDDKTIMREVLQDLFRSVPQLKELPGAEIIDRMSRQQQSKTSKQQFTSRCSCLAITAQRETRIDHMLWVASLRFYEPTGVKQFRGVMQRLDRLGQCRKGTG
ncbi:MAG: hypothetical protein JJ964_13205 [Rhizobiales bacterium]|nr:hypothetical protein [Hyphomicrobiales bacterium]